MDEQQVLVLFEQFRVAYPKRDGSNPRKPAWEKWCRYMKAGVDPGAIIAGAKLYAAELVRQGKNNTPFVAMTVTWLNQRRWEDYTPLVPTKKPEAVPVATTLVPAELKTPPPTPEENARMAEKFRALSQELARSVSSKQIQPAYEQRERPGYMQRVLEDLERRRIRRETLSPNDDGGLKRLMPTPTDPGVS